MKNIKNHNYDDFYDFEEISSKLVNRFLKNYEKSLKLNFRKFDLRKTCEKYIYYKINSSFFFYTFFLDIKYKRAKKKYTFDSYELKLLAEDLSHIYKIRDINFSYKKNYIKKIFFFFIYSFFISFSFLFSFKKIKNKNIICILNHNKFKKEFDLLLRNIKKKKKYLSYRNFIPLTNIGLLKLNFKIYFQNISKQKEFFFMHRLYLKTYIFDTNIRINNPLFIIFYEGDAADHEISAEIGNNQKVKTVCIQWGSVIYNKPKSSFRNSGYSILLAWGKNYMSMFKKYNPKIRVDIIGTPHLKNIKNKGKKILFLLPQESSQFDNNEMIKYYNFIKILAKKLPNKILIRSHPQNNYNKNIKEVKNIQGIEIDNARKTSLNDSLSKSLVMITAGSSSIFEAAIHGVIPIIYAQSERNIWNKNIQRLKRDYSIKLFENQNIGKLEKTILTLIDNKRLLKKISKKITKDFKNEIAFYNLKSFNKFNKIIKNLSKISK
jgi:hypothetical protein